MFYHQSSDTRALFFQSWSKFKQKMPLIPLEQQLVAVILEHPEYHALFDDPHFSLERKYFPELGETNPFLHLGLHLAIREQIATNRPLGIQPLFHTLSQQLGNNILETEHQMMNCLMECLWQAQRDNSPPDELKFLKSCQQLLNTPIE